METVVLDWVGHTVAVECVLVRRSGGVPLRGLGFGLAASGSAGAGSYRSSVGAGCCGADAMACTNQRCGWPGNRWGRGPNWATTGVIRPVTEISGRVDVAVHDFTGERAHQVLVDSAFTDQAAWGAVRCGAAVVDLAGGKPAIRHDQVAAVAGSLVDQLRPNQSHRSIRDGPAKRSPAHALFHGGHVEILDHDAAVGARQLGGEPVGGFPPQVHTPAVEADQLGFRVAPSSGAGYAAGKFTTGPSARGQRHPERGRIRVLGQCFDASRRISNITLNVFTPRTMASMGRPRCGWCSTARASRWPAAPSSG